jgi:hypothetical protein
MIFKKQAIYKGTKYIRVNEDYRDTTNIQSRCYTCKYRGYVNICLNCREVMHLVDAERSIITFGYMPIK